MDFRIGILIGASLWLVAGQKYANKIKGCISLTNVFEPCGCTISQETFDLLCASDGHTYLSKCSFNCQKTLGKDKISVDHKGACSKETRCTCQKGYVPQCGTNGVTYPNECVLNCFMKKDSTIRLKHTGECESVSKRSFDPEEPKNQKNKPENCCCCKCCSSNLKRLRTRFGNNGKRYARSSCGCRHERKTEAPRTPPPTKLATQPPSCAFNNPPQIQPLSSQGCPNEPQACQLKETENIPKKKRCVCAMLHRPLCGNDKQTYVNFCVLDCTKRRNPSVDIQHWGVCGNPQKTPWDYD